MALLGRLGYRTDVAANGVEAVDAVMRQPYDLILLDIQMPQMDGVEAAAAMRRKLKGRCPRLVALTANAFPGAREQYLSQGFDDYMSKPLLPETLQRRAERNAGLGGGSRVEHPEPRARPPHWLLWIVARRTRFLP